MRKHETDLVVKLQESTSHIRPEHNEMKKDEGRKRHEITRFFKIKKRC